MVIAGVVARMVARTVARMVPRIVARIVARRRTIVPDACARSDVAVGVLVVIG